MKVSVEKLPTSEAVLEVDIPWDEVEKASDKAYRKLVQKVDVQGFRRGKAPRSLLERRLGKEYIYQEGLDELIAEAYRNALKEHDLTPITQPKMDAPPLFELGQSYHVSLSVPIITPVELGDYSSLHFDREEADVTSEEVEQELAALRDRMVTWEAVERPAAYGDRITVDLKLTSEDQSISDLKNNPFELTQERHGIFVGMDEQVIGMQVGETKSFSTTIPADYNNEKLAGKQGDYVITLHKIEEKHLPEIDDAFAEKLSGGQFQTLEDLSKMISDGILERKKRNNNNTLREKVINAVIELSHFTLHPLLVREEAEEMIHQFSHMLEQQHLSLDQYLKMMQKNREEYLQEIGPEAENRVKRQLVLEEVARREEIGIEAGEIEALFNAYAQAGQELPRTEAQVRALAVNYRREKALTHLVEAMTDPDPDEESKIEASQDITLEQAEAITASTIEIEADGKDVETEGSVTALPDEPTSNTVE